MKGAQWVTAPCKPNKRTQYNEGVNVFKISPLAALALLSMLGCNSSSSEPGTQANTAQSSESVEAPQSEPPKEAPPASTGDVSDRKPKDGEEVGVLDTGSGRIVVMFFPDKAPKMVARFKECLTKGVYTGTYFHRVIPGFMIQGGDPNTKNSDRADDGQGGYGSMLPAEFNDVKHVRGILSTARTSDPNSAQSQFFIMHGTSPSLDNQYTVFGKVVEGLDVVDKIVNQPRDPNDNPKDHKAVTITKASLEKWPVTK